MKKLFFLFFLASCVEEQPYDFPNMEDALNDICKPIDGYLLRRDESKTYILTGATDNLSSTDIAIMDIGLYCLGFSPLDIDIAINFDNIGELVQQQVYFFYFSGHGNEAGSILTDDGIYNTSVRKEKYSATNVMFSACSVLKNQENIEKEINDSVQYVMGYTDKSFDDIDNIVVLEMLKELKRGNSIPMSFYLANIRNYDLKDRWIIYQHTSREIYEYSARSKTEFVE